MKAKKRHPGAGWPARMALEHCLIWRQRCAAGIVSERRHAQFACPF
ncbi:MAG: hypothetical protein K6T30_00195 [Alicyclobacillus sp.]|nr:hypothetical protein [Alicyclobacillus sp.]